MQHKEMRDFLFWKVSKYEMGGEESGSGAIERKEGRKKERKKKLIRIGTATYDYIRNPDQTVRQRLSSIVKRKRGNR